MIDISLFAAAILDFFLCFTSPGGQRWQCPQLFPFWQPCGFQNQPHGRHCPAVCSTEPIEGNGPGKGRPAGASDRIDDMDEVGGDGENCAELGAALVGAAVDSLLPASLLLLGVL